MQIKIKKAAVIEDGLPLEMAEQVFEVGELYRDKLGPYYIVESFTVSTENTQRIHLNCWHADGAVLAVGYH